MHVHSHVKMDSSNTWSLSPLFLKAAGLQQGLMQGCCKEVISSLWDFFIFIFLVKGEPFCNLTLGVLFSKESLNCRNVKRG